MARLSCAAFLEQFLDASTSWTIVNFSVQFTETLRWAASHSAPHTPSGHEKLDRIIQMFCTICERADHSVCFVLHCCSNVDCISIFIYIPGFCNNIGQIGIWKKGSSANAKFCVPPKVKFDLIVTYVYVTSVTNILILPQIFNFPWTQPGRFGAQTLPSCNRFTTLAVPNSQYVKCYAACSTLKTLPDVAYLYLLTWLCCWCQRGTYSIRVWSSGHLPQLPSCGELGVGTCCTLTLAFCLWVLPRGSWDVKLKHREIWWIICLYA